jgi:hypothetical protein
MRFLLAPALLAAAFAASGQELEIQRALIQRDQQSAEFAARLRGEDSSSLERLHARQLLEVVTRPLSPDPQAARQLQPYQRQQMADGRTLFMPPPVRLARRAEDPASRALPLPGRPRHVVDPIPAQGVPY